MIVTIPELPKPEKKLLKCIFEAYEKQKVVCGLHIDKAPTAKKVGCAPTDLSPLLIDIMVGHNLASVGDNGQRGFIGSFIVHREEFPTFFKININKEAVCRLAIYNNWVK